MLAFSKDFVTIGWRIGFLVGGSVAFLGAFLRYLATESLPFEKIKSEGKISKVPSLEVFKYARKPIILLMLAIGVWASLNFHEFLSNSQPLGFTGVTSVTPPPL